MGRFHGWWDFFLACFIHPLQGIQGCFSASLGICSEFVSPGVPLNSTDNRAVNRGDCSRLLGDTVVPANLGQGRGGLG